MERQQVNNSPSLESPRRLRVLSRLHSEMHVQSPTVLGREHLLDLPKNKAVVIAPTHLSDIDVETAIADISQYRNVGVAAESTNLQIQGAGPINKFATKGNLFEISGKLNKKTGRAEYKFDPDNFKKMKAALDKGIDIIFAGQVPTYNWELPDSPGLGAVFLAQQMDTPIVLPVAVDIDNQSGKIKAAIITDVVGMARRLMLRQRPATKLIYGEAIHFEKLPQNVLDLIARLFNEKERHTLTGEEKLEAKQALEKLREQGKVLTNAIADLLPSEKRGRWGTQPIVDK